MAFSRRQVCKGLCSAAFLGAGAPILDYNNANGSKQVPIRVGLELASVHYALEKDFEGALRRVAELGYKEVEFPWYFGRSPSQIKNALSAFGLRCRSGLFRWNDLKTNLSEQIAFAGD